MPDLFHTFDLFDTCITRMHAHPRDLFFELGLSLAPEDAKQPFRQRFARRFQRARIRAEKIANWQARRNGAVHADIHAIYRTLPRLMQLDRPMDELVTAELALEEEGIYAVPEILAQINRLRAAGQPIVFISDMYIPGDLLGPLLMRKGVMQEGDRLYVSCDLGCSKHSGGLFDEVLAREGLQPSDVLHTGDNEHADVRMAKARGIRTRHFTTTHLLGREAIIAGPRIPHDPAASWQAAFSRRCRLAVQHELGPETAHPLDGLIFGVIMPFLLAYVLWLLDDARRRGIKRLYFVARDGEVLLKIAGELKPDDIELRYLYGSRRAWLPAAADPQRSFWRNTLAVPGQKNTPRDIVERTGLGSTETETVRSALGLDELAWSIPLSRNEATTFVEALMSQPQALHLIRNSATTKCNMALRYFTQEGLLDGTPWALVDAGWSLNAQAALKGILGTHASVPATQGYYIGLSHDHLPLKDAGDAFSFTRTGSIFSRRRVVVEHCFLASAHRSVTDYGMHDGFSRPLFCTLANKPEYAAYASRLHKACVHGARLLAELPALMAAFQGRSQAIVSSAQGFLAAPAPSEVKAVSGFSVTPDIRQDAALQRQMARVFGMQDVANLLARSISKGRAFSSPAWIWPEGALAISSSAIKILLSPFLLIQRMRKLRT